MIILSDKTSLFLLLIGVLISITNIRKTQAMSGEHSSQDSRMISLPSPALKGPVSVEEAINNRWTCSDFAHWEK